MRKWKDLQMEVLGLAFSRTRSGAVVSLNDDDVLEYVAEMPDAANYALRDLCRIAKPLVRKYEIVQSLPENLLGISADTVFSHEESADTYEADGKSYTFEVIGPAEVEIWDGDTLKDTVKHEKPSFERFSGNCENGVRLVFKGAWPYQYRGVAVYRLKYKDVPPFQTRMRYRMKELTDDFMELMPRQFQQNGLRRDEFDWESDDTLVLSREVSGVFTVFYKAYPKPLTSETPEEYEIELPDDIIDLAAYYIASRVIKEDDIQVSTAYLNQYQVKRDELKEIPMLNGRAEFYSVGGWY